MKKLLKAHTKEQVENKFDTLRRFGWEKKSEIVFEPDENPPFVCVIENKDEPRSRGWGKFYLF